MGVLRHRHHHHHHAFTAFTFLLFASASVLALSLLGTGFQEREGSEKRSSASGAAVLGRFLAQKRLAGPGSSPPTCKSKCGNCSPCQPVHVPIQPGFSVPLEYYPEAWRCKCGNKLFMP